MRTSHCQNCHLSNWFEILPPVGFQAKTYLPMFTSRKLNKSDPLNLLHKFHHPACSHRLGSGSVENRLTEPLFCHRITSGQGWNTKRETRLMVTVLCHSMADVVAISTVEPREVNKLIPIYSVTAAVCVLWCPTMNGGKKWVFTKNASKIYCLNPHFLD